MSDKAAVRAASTVILVRDGAGGVEVFLIRRPPNASFFGGSYVFPGGAVDATDCSPKTAAHLGAAAVAACRAALDVTPGKDLEPEAAAGAYVAACREVFEECGVLLAGDGPWHERRDALAAARRRLHDGETDLLGLLTELQAQLDLEALAYWAHWITPSVERKRFDTRFFVARLPTGQEASIDAEEAVDHLWATPAAALAASVRGDIALPPPTYRNLEELAELTEGSTGVAALWSRLAARRVVAIQPKIRAIDHALAILLPWDPLYPESEGEALPPLDYPASWTSGVSRIVLRDGRWMTQRG